MKTTVNYDEIISKRMERARVRASLKCDNASLWFDDPFGICPECGFEHRCKRLDD
jgi:hypothetical protein